MAVFNLKTRSNRSLQVPQEAIQKLAYELYEKRGRQEGHDVEDWLLAEEMLRSQSVFKL